LSVASAVRRRRTGTAVSMIALACACAGPAWATPRSATALPPPSPDDLRIDVVRGDTLIGLAARHLAPGTGWRALQRLNGVAEPRRLPEGSTLRVPAAWLKAQEVIAEVVHVRGEASVQRDGVSGPAQLGARLRRGDRLRVAPESSLTLRFADGSRLLLRPDSELALTRLLQRTGGSATDTGLRLERGSADSRVVPLQPAGRYELVTPAVHVGVRGTEFRTAVEAGTAVTRVEVLEGSVAASPGARRDAAGARTAQRVGAGEAVLGAPSAAALSTARLAPPPDIAPVPAKIERVPLRLAWSAQPGIAAWRAQVVAENTPDALLLDGRFGEPSARWVDLPDGRYELRVRAIDGHGFEGLDARRSFVLKARPLPPFTSQPRADAQLSGERVQFGWTRAEEAASYRFQLAADADFAAPLADVPALTQPAHGLTLPPGRYFWRLASVRADGDPGPFGDAQAFTLKPPPPAPPLAPPQVDGDRLVLRWPAGDASLGALRYELQLARDREFRELVHGAQTTEPEAVLPRPEAGLYFARVRAIDAQGTAGPYGGVQQVEIPRSRWWLLLPAGLLLLLAL
jgi:hypothetical protein